VVPHRCGYQVCGFFLDLHSTMVAAEALSGSSLLFSVLSAARAFQSKPTPGTRTRQSEPEVQNLSPVFNSRNTSLRLEIPQETDMITSQRSVRVLLCEKLVPAARFASL
jgi:hypothetical protein